MAKKVHAYLPETRSALEALGAQIAAGRRRQSWTTQQLAGRLGVGVASVARIEHGAAGTAVGTVLEAAVLCGVPLFGVDGPDRAARLTSVADRAAVALALLPRRVVPAEVEIDNDF